MNTGRYRLRRFGKINEQPVKIFIGAVLFRLGVYFLSFCVMVIFGEYGADFGLEEFTAGWNRWDADHYLKIARFGYGGYTEEGQYLMLVFFPFYPWLINVLGLVIPDLALCGLLISTFTYAGGCCFFYLWMTAGEGGGEGKKEEAALNGVVLLSIFPFAFFFGGIMTESLFLLASMGAFYYLKKRNWWLAGLMITIGGLTRLQGGLVVLAAVTEVLMVCRPVKLMKAGKYGEVLRMLGVICYLGLCMVVSIGTYLWINWQVSGNPFQFQVYQKEHWGQSFGFLPDTIGYLWEYATASLFQSNSLSLWMPELVLFGIGLLALIYGCLGRHKQSLSMMVYLAGYLVVVYSATWLLSAGRYMACAVPLFIMGGEWLARHPRWKLPVYWLSASLFMIYMIGYFQWRQIM